MLRNKEFSNVQAPRKRPGGLHIASEWFDCSCDPLLLSDARELRETVLAHVVSCGMTIVGEAFHQFDPVGATGVFLLAESHLALHTWPDEAFVSIDVYVCNYLQDNTAKAEALYRDLYASFLPAADATVRLREGSHAMFTE